MKELINYLPDIQGNELMYIKSLVKEMTEEERQTFYQMYRNQRKSPQLILILTLLGFAGLAGVQRIITDQIGLGILYFLTGGLCGIGTIVDLIKYKDIALQYNQQLAYRSALFVKEASSI